MQIENYYILVIINTAQRLPTSGPSWQNLTSSTVLSLVVEYNIFKYKHFGQI